MPVESQVAASEEFAAKVNAVFGNQTASGFAPPEKFEPKSAVDAINAFLLNFDSVTAAAIVRAVAFAQVELFEQRAETWPNEADFHDKAADMLVLF
jgi:hypothetical protein